MEAEASDTAADSPARVLLTKQAALIEKQAALSDAQRRSENLGATLKALTIGVGAMAAVAVAALAWQARSASGVVIQAFSVPPDLAQRGLTGEVVASKLLDDLAAMQAATNDARPAASYTNNWNGDIKVEIPETGVSLGELRRLLVDWFGHQTVINGEVYRSADSLVLVARTGDQPAKEHAGQEADLDGLVQAAAEDIYIVTQPYRAAVYLRDHGRVAEAVSLMQANAAQGPAVERAYSYTFLGSLEMPDAGLPLFRRASALAPQLHLPASFIAGTERNTGHPEAAMAADQLALATLKRPNRGGLPPVEAASQAANATAWIYTQRGDFTAGLAHMRGQDDAGLVTRSDRVWHLIPDYIGLHELSAARANLALLDTPEGGVRRLGNTSVNVIQWTLVDRAQLESAAENWNVVLALAPLADMDTAFGPRRDTRFGARRVAQFDPLVAYAKARLGDMAGAEALIATTPIDSYDALIARAKIAALAKDWATVDRWFGEAVRQNPSIPFAYAQWGEVLLAKGDPDAAIAKLKAAAKRGPRFADPLETWGEALMVKGDYRGAIGKFTQANKYAPRWGRLHLKWAMVLAAQGKTAEARQHRATAARLDLTPAERAELNAFRV